MMIKWLYFVSVFIISFISFGYLFQSRDESHLLDAFIMALGVTGFVVSVMY